MHEGNKNAVEELIAFDELGYTPVELMQEDRKDLLSFNPKTTMRMIHAYYFGSGFNHREAYDLCAVGLTWPEFCYHPTNKGYVLKYSQVNSLDSTVNETNLHEKFENFVENNRQNIAKKAAENLSLSWEEIEKAK